MIRTEQAHLSVKALSHPGMTGKNNEDRFAVSAFRLSAHNSTPVLLAVLADGIGGHRAGEVAAEMVVEAVSRKVAASDGRHPTQILSQAVIEASRAVYTYAQQNGATRGMGATVACAWIIGARLYVTAIGDSRIYLIREGQIRQLTTDHTWIQEALDKGLLKPEEARGHPNAHVIRRFVGSPTPPEVDLRLRLNAGENDLQAEANQGLRLRPGDRLLLCSDGLTDLVSAEELLETNQEGELEESVQKLVDLACERGGHDNITLVEIDVPESIDAAVETVQRKSDRRPGWLLGCGGAALIALIIGAFFLFYWSGWLPVLLPWGGPSPATPTGTLPAALQTLLPGATQTSPPGPTSPSETPSAASLAPTSGPTYTPWPTATLLPSNVVTATAGP